MISNVTVENNPWQNLHLSLQDMLAGYVDNELTTQQNDIIEAHLAGCCDCRADILRQQAISDILNELPVKSLSRSAHQHLKQVILAVEAPEDNLALNKIVLFRNRFFSCFSKINRLGASGWVVASVFLVMLLLPTSNQFTLNKSKIPMLTDALAVYQEIQHQALPNIELTHNDVAPVNWQQGKLLVSWPAKIGGAPAEVFAILHHNHVVLQYKIDKTVFLRNPIVRKAIATQGFFKTKLTNLDVLVLPSQNSGVIIISPQNLLPEAEIIRSSST